jgi:Tol biopolymer transport system component
LRLDTGEIRTVLGWGHTGRFVPTGHLTYYRAGTLLAVPFDLARLAVTSSTPVAIVEGVPQGERTGGAEYSISSSGSLAYIPANRRQFERQLAWVDRNGAVEPLPAPPLNYRNLSLSPDGRLVALTVTSGTRDIWIYDLERRTLTRLATESGVSNPIWTPDGKRITYRGLKEGRRNLFWKLADGSGSEERLTTSESPQNVVSWSPDGQWLSFIENTLATSYDIWMLRLDGERRPQPFLQTQFDERNAIFSPDGHWLAYQSAESGRFEVYIQPFPGPGGKWRVSTEGGSEPRWARNGHELFYRDGNKMMAVDIKTGPTFAAGKHRILFEGQFLAYDVSLDSQRFLMIQAVELEQPATQINLVLNWFEELKSLVPTGKR